MKMKGQNSQRGMSLIEVLVAMMVTVVGVVAVATLILYGIGLQVQSRDATMANALAKSKIEELSLSISLLEVGGDLDNNVTGYNDMPTGYTVRWAVAAGPANTLDVTVRVIAENPAAAVSPVVDIQVLMDTS